MIPDQDKQQQTGSETPSSVNIGNASNPSSRPDSLEPTGDSQFLSEGAEKYLREVASVEDYPDAHDQQQMDDAIEEDKNSKK